MTNWIESMEISSIRIVLDPGNQGWILEKIAIRLRNQFELNKYKSEIDSVPDEKAQVNLWMQYTDKTLVSCAKSGLTKCFALVTHVDDSFKLARVKLLIQLKVTIIFMSEAHAHEVAEMLDIDEAFEFALIPSDFNNHFRPFRIGIVSKCYPDGRKNENWLVKFAKDGILNNCEFAVVGEGWEATITNLKVMGIPCEIFSNSNGNAIRYEDIKSFYDTLDLYIYFGFDEGALGSLDAYLFRKDILVTRQGFHTHFALKEDSFVLNYEDAKFKLNQKIVEYRLWLETTLPWTWDFYAKKLISIFERYEVQASTSSSGNNFFSMNLSLLLGNRAYRTLLPLTSRRMVFVRFPQKVRNL